MPPKGTCYFCGKKDVYVTTRWRFTGKGEIEVVFCCSFCDKVLDEIEEIKATQDDETRDEE